MIRSSRRLLLPSASLGLLALAGAMVPPVQPVQQEFKVGVVNIAEVMDAFEGLRNRKQNAVGRHRQEFQTLQAQLDIPGLEARVEMTEIDSREGQRARLDLQSARERLDLEDRMLSAALQAKLADLEVDAFEDVQRIVDEIATALDLDLVLREHAVPGDMSKGGQRQVHTLRVVMFHNKDLDITPLVIQRLPKSEPAPSTPPGGGGSSDR